MKTISGKRLCEILESKGWLLKRVNGSHYIYSKSGHDELLVIPVHKNEDLKLGLLKSVMRIADIQENEL